MMIIPQLALLALSFSLVVSKDPQQQLIDLASANKGVIPLDEATYNLLSSPKRNWSASVQFTAMDKRRRCAPCKSVLVFCLCYCLITRETQRVRTILEHGSQVLDNCPQARAR